jgi:nucleoside permease NupC
MQLFNVIALVAFVLLTFLYAEQEDIYYEVVTAMISIQILIIVVAIDIKESIDNKLKNKNNENT